MNTKGIIMKYTDFGNHVKAVTDKYNHLTILQKNVKIEEEYQTRIKQIPVEIWGRVRDVYPDKIALDGSYGNSDYIEISFKQKSTDFLKKIQDLKKGQAVCLFLDTSIYNGPNGVLGVAISYSTDKLDIDLGTKYVQDDDNRIEQERIEEKKKKALEKAEYYERLDAKRRKGNFEAFLTLLIGFLFFAIVYYVFLKK